jgi:hypothetical protein
VCQTALGVGGCVAEARTMAKKQCDCTCMCVLPRCRLVLTRSCMCPPVADAVALVACVACTTLATWPMPA